MASFQGESNKLSDSKQKALENFKAIVQEALNNGLFFSSSLPEKLSTWGVPLLNDDRLTWNTPQRVSIWGVPLLEDHRSDVILLKFLRARDFNQKESFAMLRNTIKWRKQFNVDELVNEHLGDDLEKVVFMHGHDKEGRPVCYDVYWELQRNIFLDDEEKRIIFLRRRIQILERSIRKVDFSSGAESVVNTIFQVSDLRGQNINAAKHIIKIVEDNYPGFVAMQVFINVPWWGLAFCRMILHFSKSKFVQARSCSTAKTLIKHISPEKVPIQYGGLSVPFCFGDFNLMPFTVDDQAYEFYLRVSNYIQIKVNEKSIVFWEIRILNWNGVVYGCYFLPDAEPRYQIIIEQPWRIDHKAVNGMRMVECNSYKANEKGTIILTISSIRIEYVETKVLYRYKIVL